MNAVAAAQQIMDGEALLPINEMPDPDYMIEDFDKPNIFICGPSGSGKSTSLRNLDPERTIILNTERKRLPFKGAKRFKLQIEIDSLAKFDHAFDKALAANVDYIVIDSFTSLTELVYASVVRNVEKDGDNVMAAWAKYKDTLHDILLKGKVANKYIIFIGIDDTIQDEKLQIIRTIAVQGSLKGKAEKEFEIVLWTKVVEADDIAGTGRAYKFVTNSDGSNKAKSPMEMFSELYIDNDLNAAIQAVNRYYSEE